MESTQSIAEAPEVIENRSSTEQMAKSGFFPGFEVLLFVEGVALGSLLTFRIPTGHGPTDYGNNWAAIFPWILLLLLLPIILFVLERSFTGPKGARFYLNLGVQVAVIGSLFYFAN